ncbi:MAG: CBS domain-containing protein [Thermoleophilia bacterium]|nr:CBS domain-containing protein [Thermoleophilia bacterium]MDH4346013.1 CBS domain-containing protein [Thermoleophilia bacterium]
MIKHEHVCVREVMTETPFVVDGLATVREAIEIMAEHRVSSLVVGRRHEGDEYGLIVVSDIAEQVISVNRSPDRTNVYEVMSKPVLSLDAEMDIKYAVRLLCRFELSRAVVLDHGNLIGIVTLRDLVLRYVAATARP